MKHSEHNKKNDAKIPAWLYFAVYDYNGKLKTKDPIEIMANVLSKLKSYYEERKALGLAIELKPNLYDNAGIYGKCPCQDCCKVKTNVAHPGKI